MCLRPTTDPASLALRQTLEFNFVLVARQESLHKPKMTRPWYEHFISCVSIDQKGLHLSLGGDLDGDDDDWDAYLSVQDLSVKDWEEMGRHLSGRVDDDMMEGAIEIYGRALNDEKITSFFRGLTRDNVFHIFNFSSNGLSAAGIRGMVPFLHNSVSLQYLDLDNNDIQSEGFNELFRALHNSPIETLRCASCDIESIEINSELIPTKLTVLHLPCNKINADGCHELAKLLQGGESTLETLVLSSNNIDDEGVEILVDALQNNKTLSTLDLNRNDDISKRGKIMLLKLVNDISSIEATLQSNHTLKHVIVGKNNAGGRLALVDIDIVRQINLATQINAYPENSAGEKVISSHLCSKNRAELYRIQGVDHSVYREIDPLLLPEVLSLIGDSYGHGELFLALSASVTMLFSTVNRKKCVLQQREYHAANIAGHRAKVEELDAELAAEEKEAFVQKEIAYHAAKLEFFRAELAAIKQAKGQPEVECELRGSKRRRG